MFRPRKKSMLGDALRTAGIDIRVGVGKEIIDKIAECGNWQESRHPPFREIYVRFRDKKSVEYTNHFTVWAGFQESNFQGLNAYWVAELDRDYRSLSECKWNINIWDFNGDSTIKKTIYSQYDLTGKKLSNV